MVGKRWSSLAVALLLLVPSTAALAKDHDDDHARFERGWDHDDHWDHDDRWDRDDHRDRDDRYYRYDERRLREVAFNNGYADGFKKGDDDAEDRRAFDPVRQKWYRSGDRHYDSRLGPKALYENIYRDGFRSGYQAGYAQRDRSQYGYGYPRPY